MPPRVKKMIGGLTVCLFVVFWVFLAVSLSGFVPDNRIAELLFYAVMGLGWALPVMPILAWMERTSPRRNH